MPRRATSGVPGLTKKHERGCSKPRRLEKCDCAWRGSRKGHYNIVLHLWCREGSVNPRDKGAAQRIVERMRAVPEEEFDPAGERQASTGGTALTDFIQDWWRDHVVKHELNTDGLGPMCELIKRELGHRSLQDLVKDREGIETWLHGPHRIKIGKTTRWRTVTWGRKTFNDYRALLLRLFKRAVALEKVEFNPIDGIARHKGVDNHRGELRHFRMTREGLQQALLDACDQLNRAQCPNRNKLTQEQADAIRAAVEDGAMQKDQAAHYGVSATVVSQIIGGTIWNPARRVVTTKGNEMRRRVQGAFDMGPRAEELTWFQLKHVRWNEWRPHPEQGHRTYKLVLPAEKTKGGKTTGRDEVFYATDKDHCAMLETRREQFKNTTLRYDAYIYGTDKGYRVDDFRKSWHALYQAAGLVYGVDYGRDAGVVWHTIKHEFASRAVEESPNLEVARDRTRHGDIKTMQRYVHTNADAAWNAAMSGRKQR